MSMKFKTSLLLMMLSISIINCKNIMNSENKRKSKSYIGTKKPSETKKIGDLVFTDGSAIGYTPELVLTDNQKENAIAVIFYSSDKSNSSLGAKTLGIGIRYCSTEIPWCVDKAISYIPEIVCEVSGGERPNYKFTGDIDGSDNWSLIKSKSPYNLMCYPVFKYAEEYKNKLPNLIGTLYEDGWYIPSLAELSTVYNQKGKINLVLNILNEPLLGSTGTHFWTSSQAKAAESACSIFFFMGDAGVYPKKEGRRALVIHRFN